MRGRWLLKGFWVKAQFLLAHGCRSPYKEGFQVQLQEEVWKQASTGYSPALSKTWEGKAVVIIISCGPMDEYLCCCHKMCSSLLRVNTKMKKNHNMQILHCCRTPSAHNLFILALSYPHFRVQAWKAPNLRNRALKGVGKPNLKLTSWKSRGFWMSFQGW